MNANQNPSRFSFLILLIAGLLCWSAPRARAAAAGGISAVDPVELALEKLAGTHGVNMEVPAKAGAKPNTPKPGEAKKEESDFEESAEEREEREALEREAKEKKEEGKGEPREDAENAEKTEAQLEIEAFTQRVSDLEKKLEDASEDEKATVQAELDEANEGLKLWEEEAGKEATAERPEFGGEQEAYVKGVEQQAADAKKEKEALEAKVVELEQAVARAGEAPIGAQEVHPLMYTDKAEDIEAADATLRNFEKWALENWDGTEEVQDAKGKVTPGYSKAAVRGRYAEIKELREKLIPLARETAATRAKGEQASRKIYPELFDSKRPEGKVAQNLLRSAPVLKAILGPNVWTIIGDAIQGEKLRLAKGKQLPSARGAAGANGRKNLPRAAKPGGGGGAGSGMASAARASAKRKAEPVVNMDAFMNGGGDKAALIKALS